MNSSKSNATWRSSTNAVIDINWKNEAISTIYKFNFRRWAMTKEKFLTLRWNNVLTLGLGLLVLIYVFFVYSNPVSSELAAFIGLVLLGVAYWIVVEQHANMRFAWLRENSGEEVSAEQSSLNRAIYIAYNIIWWVPIVLPLTKIIDYQTGFILLFIVTIIRAGANLYRNNVLSPEQAAYFPLRSPWIVENFWLSTDWR